DTRPGSTIRHGIAQPLVGAPEPAMEQRQPNPGKERKKCQGSKTAEMRQRHAVRPVSVIAPKCRTKGGNRFRSTPRAEVAYRLLRHISRTFPLKTLLAVRAEYEGEFADVLA